MYAVWQWPLFNQLEVSPSCCVMWRTALLSHNYCLLDNAKLAIATVMFQVLICHLGVTLLCMFAIICLAYMHFLQPHIF